MSKTVTMEHVAERAGVSRALVSLVMRGHASVSPERRARVLAAADELGYVPNRLASRLASQRTRTIGVMLLNIDNTVFGDIYDGIVEGLADSGYQPLLAVGSLEAETEALVLRRLRALQVDGLLLGGYTGGAEQLAAFSKVTPTAVITREVPAPYVDCVLADERAAAREATEYLIGLGHRDILHISNQYALPYPERREGYAAAMEEAGLAPRVIEGDMSRGGGRRAVGERLALGDRFTAVFAHNDLTAVGALEGLQEAGRRVPEDVSVIGFDSIDLARSPLIGLASVSQRTSELGRTAAELLLDRLEGDGAMPARVIRRPARLELGRTTGPAPAV